jgi:hypothetical protein
MAVWGLKEERAVGKLPGADPATGSGCRAFELRLVERSGGKGGALRREVGPAVTTLGGRSLMEFGNEKAGRIAARGAGEVRRSQIAATQGMAAWTPLRECG